MVIDNSDYIDIRDVEWEGELIQFKCGFGSDQVQTATIVW